MNEPAIDPILLFMLLGLAALVLLLVFRPGGRRFLIAKVVGWLRAKSRSTDLIFTALDIAGHRWKVLLIPIAISVVFEFLFDLAVRYVMTHGPSGQGIPLYIQYSWFIPVVFSAAIGVWVIRILMKDQTSLAPVRWSLTAFAAFIIIVYGIGYGYSVATFFGMFWQTLNDWSFHALQNADPMLWPWFGFGIVVYPLACLLLVWVPQIHAERLPKFGPFVQRSWHYGLYGAWLIFIVSFFMNVVWQVYDIGFYTVERELPSGWLQAYYIANQIVSGVISEVFAVIRFAVIVVVSSAAVKALTEA